MLIDLDEAVRKHNVSLCLGCGKCTYACLISHRYDFSPRGEMEKYAGKKKVGGTGFWSCTTCGACSQVCPYGVDFKAFMRDARSVARPLSSPIPTHNGVLDIVRNISSKEFVRPKTNTWVTKDLELDDKSETLLFAGCIPYFDIVFKQFRKNLLEIPRSSVRLLNVMGIKPKLMEGERCCGHDAYWLGDDATFERLAKMNIEAIKRSGAKEVVTFCPECYLTLKHIYPERFGKLSFEVKNLTLMLPEALESGRLELKNGADLTFQDPCRFSKHLGVIEEPRKALGMLGKVREMPRSKEVSACCGTACWVNCDETAKSWQIERLREAGDTGAEKLVTACPKCLIHLSCADEHHGADLERRLPITDIHVLAASRIKKS